MSLTAWLISLSILISSSIPLLGLSPKSPETQIQENLCTPKFIAAQFTIARYWKQPKCPLANEWIQKLWYIYTMEFYAVERKKELIPFATAWMELESIMLSEISQAVRDKYHMTSAIFTSTVLFHYLCHLSGNFKIPSSQNFLSFLYFKLYFIDYAVTIFPFFPTLFPLCPALPNTPAFSPP